VKLHKARTRVLTTPRLIRTRNYVHDWQNAPNADFWISVPTTHALGDRRQAKRLWGARGSERYRQANREYMRDYRRNPVRRQRANVLRKRRRQKKLRKTRAAQQAAALNAPGLLLATLRRRRYYIACKMKGWRRVQVLDPCAMCGAPTRWRKWVFSGTVGIDFETMMEKIVDLKWQWVTKCRACNKREAEPFNPRRITLGVLYTSSDT
jgi:hypothetical protein